MTELETLKSQLRENQMRLRELRTENAELKIQYRRWQLSSAIISGLSLLVAFYLLVTDSGPSLKIVRAPTEPLGSSTVEHIAPPSTMVEAPPVEVPMGETIPKAHESSGVTATEPQPSPPDPLEAPSLDFVEEEDPFTPPPFDVEEEEPPEPAIVASRPPRASTFALPGVGSKPERRVERHTVIKHENLWRIVEKYYGRVTPRIIKKVMKDNGLSSSRIQPGTTLLLIIEE